jgi:hypothetical protein
MSDKTPLSPNLNEKLARTEAIKADMLALLSELEQTALGEAKSKASKDTPGKPGGWRHHPAEWDKRLT